MYYICTICTICTVSISFIGVVIVHIGIHTRSCERNWRPSVGSSSMRLGVLAHQLEMVLSEEELCGEPYWQAEKLVSGESESQEVLSQTMKKQ